MLNCGIQWEHKKRRISEGEIWEKCKHSEREINKAFEILDPAILYSKRLLGIFQKSDTGIF